MVVASGIKWNSIGVGVTIPQQNNAFSFLLTGNFEYAAEVRDEINELRRFAPKSEVGRNESTTKLGKDAALCKPKRGKVEK